MAVVDVIRHYQRSIEKWPENKERMLHCLGKLFHLPITVQHLQDTGIGRTVNALRKYDGDTGEAAKALVSKWKALVAAEDSGEGEVAPYPEQNNISPKEERHAHRHNEHHRSNRENISHQHHSDSKKHKEEEKLVKVKRMRIQGQSKKRRCEGENRKVTEKRRRKDEIDSESSGCENSFQAVEQEDSDSGHDSEARSSSQVSQNVGDNSSDDGAQSLCVQSHSSKRHDSNRKHEKHKVTNTSSKEKGDSSRKRDGISSSREGRNKTESKGVDESKERKTVKQKTDIRVGNKEHHHNDSSKKHKSKTGSRANNIPNVCESPSKLVNLDKTSARIKKEKLSVNDEEDGSIDCSTGASFAEALGMVDPMVKRKPHATVSSPGKSANAGIVRNAAKPCAESSSSQKKEKAGPSLFSSEFNLLSANVKLEPLEMDVDLNTTLPAINPNYKPLPHYNLLDSPPHRKTKHLTEEEALSQVMSTKNQRTKVYSGVKSGKSWANVPSLYDICVRVLQENIDALEYTGGVPYDLMKPVLQHATPEQLFMLEHHNPYLIEDTGDLWQFHCQREFRTKQRQDMETAREMYMRCLEEREAKLKALTTNIQQSIAKSTPVRQTKLAYVDSVAKPPRNVARQQAKYGTARVAKPIAAQAKAARVAGTGVTPVPAPTRHIQTATKAKPRMAPLMQKTMKLVKSFKR
ncbi:hypothetical protein B7P43_G02617 [Cryptotermes secundus]|uniref:TFIIS N-terminal domain-containing protein n=1 Tax=Cryptotermes secundus TaxID=105785 RepID=A0A2J7RLS8_9NEOP|nr:transcription elongation factor B polypeptide 3 [Cryptotermes secundus]PNF41785.1 hypothetical protein B7P43_G02617 [Cryptotermes secundus]